MKYYLIWFVGGLGTVLIVWGTASGRFGLVGAGLVGVLVCAAKHARRLAIRSWAGGRPPAAETPLPLPLRTPRPSDSNSLVTEMVGHHRYALLLRTQVIANLTPGQVTAASAALHEEMALVPPGEVELRATEANWLDPEDDSEAYVVRVGGLFLDRYPVTNAQFQVFLAEGGYEQISLWDPQIWPAVLDFVDSTGQPGPRFWKIGQFPQGKADHPVLGVSWYEAAAYARWVGKRLSTDAEWVKAGAWPISLAANARSQRRFPWGDSVDLSRTNIWASGIGDTVAVTEYPHGISVGGVCQLIGNVWEWTSGDFGALDARGSDLTLPTPMKSIRGGAFDTYFECQATCQFQSGENPLARRHNIGFRCALSLVDLAPAALPGAQVVNPPPASLAEEVTTV